MTIQISKGNSKLGTAVHNTSLLPGKTCGDVPCARRGECYALKFLHRPSVRKAWSGNTELALNDPAAYFAAVRDHLAKHQPRFWRWFVGGDFPGQAFLDQTKAIAREFPQVKFLAFTKRHTGKGKLCFKRTPSNYSIVFSYWPGWGDGSAARRYGFRRAWMQDGKETRVPANAMECPGGCEACGLCWNLKSIGRDVVFAKH